MLLIATVTTAVLFDVTGFIGGQTEQTSDETQSELTDRLDVVTATGTNITELDSGERVVTEVELVVTGFDGASPIDLRNVTIQWLASDSVTLSHAAAAGDDPAFETVALVDPDGSFPVVTNSNDRYAVRFQPGQEFGDPLAEGQQVSLTILTPGGATITEQLRVPSSLLGKQTVEL